MSGNAPPALLQQQSTASAAAGAAAGGASGGLYPSVSSSTPVLLLPDWPKETAGESDMSPLSAAAFEGLFLSMLAFLLPSRPPAAAGETQEETGDSEQENIALPEAPTPQITALPLPGGADCSLVSLQLAAAETPEAAAEAAAAEADATAAGTAFRLFCLSLVRGCPALSGRGSAAAAANGDPREETEEERRQFAADTLECSFRCYPMQNAAGQAAAAPNAAPAAAASPAPAAGFGLLQDRSSYLSKDGIFCGFVCP